MWNAVTYFTNICNKLKLTSNSYHFCRVSGLNSLEDIISEQKKHSCFFAVDDTDDGVTIRNGGGYFNRRAIVIYLLSKYKINNMEERETQMSVNRSIHQKILAKLIKDSTTVDGLIYLDKTRIPYHEVPGYFVAGTCGLYFIITIDEPINLVSDDSDFITESN